MQYILYRVILSSEDANELSVWAATWLMSLNFEFLMNCEHLLIANKNHLSITYMIIDHAICKVTSAKQLDATIAHNLSWTGTCWLYSVHLQSS